MSTIVTGHSDDVIDVEGDVTDELYPKFNDPKGTILCSDGTVLDFVYNGIWNFTVINRGDLFDHIDKGDYDADTFDKIYKFAQATDALVSW